MSDDDQAQEWVPEFEGQRPPFQPGHELSLQHGAYSPRKVEPLAGELVEHVLATAAADASMAYLRAPVYRMALWAWARAEAQAQLLSEFLTKRGHGGVGDLADERVRTAYLLLHRAEARALSGRRALGLDPLARARLGKDVAQGAAANADVALRMAQLHELEQQGWTPPPADGGPA